VRLWSHSIDELIDDARQVITGEGTGDFSRARRDPTGVNQLENSGDQASSAMLTSHQRCQTLVSNIDGRVGISRNADLTLAEARRRSMTRNRPSTLFGSRYRSHPMVRRFATNSTRYARVTQRRARFGCSRSLERNRALLHEAEDRDGSLARPFCVRCRSPADGLLRFGMTRPTRLFVLNATARPVESGARTADLRLAVGRISLPERLNRPQIVTRTGANEVQADDFAQWAESLETSIPRVLSEDLARLTGTDRVFVSPWPSQIESDLRVEVAILEFEGNREGEVSLVARWRWVRADGSGRIPAGFELRRIRRKPNDGSARRAAMSQTLGALSRDIAAAIDVSALKQRAPPPQAATIRRDLLPVLSRRQWRPSLHGGGPVSWLGLVAILIGVIAYRRSGEVR
jgi:uncharacterized lipoprotein YmbA